jgi:uncharacterized protein YndB with AHSA1/START domain
MLKTLLYVVLTTLAAVLLLAFGLGLDAGPFQIERRTEIAAPAATVFANLDDLHRWNVWFPWLKVDEHISKHVHSGAPKGVGAIYEWESDAKPGHSRIAIIESQPPQRLVARHEFFQGRAREFRLTVTLIPEGTRTQVRFVTSGTDTYASKLFGKFKDYIGHDMEQALANLAKLSVTDASAGAH